MWWLTLVACGPAAEEVDVRDSLDAPTAQLDADLIPQVADDWFRATNLYRTQDWALGLVSLARGLQGRRALPIDTPEVPAEPLLGGVVCAASYIAELASYEQCERGDTCTAQLTLRSCLLTDAYARGKMQLRVSEQQGADFDRGSLEIEFDDFRTDDPLRAGFASELDGIILVEGTTFSEREREEIVYLADFRTRELDMGRRGVFGGGVVLDQQVRAGIRLAAESTEGAEEVSVEMVAFVDDDGDGIPTASVVIRMGLQELEGGELEGLTLVLEGAGGGWTCTWDTVDLQSDDLSTTTSSGFCIDPDGNRVGFSGTVEG